MRRVQLLVLLAACATAGCMPPSWGAGALLHPGRRAVGPPPHELHRDLEFEGAGGVQLEGWLFPAAGPRTGVTVVYLHGSGDNRESGTWIAAELTQRGFDVLAYDGRAHGASGGAACTYGYYERQDLRRALDAVGARRAILLGVSLGGAVALQAAPDDERVIGVVAVATYADLESIARDRAPFFASEGQIREAFALAEQEAHFRVAEVSPVRAAARIRVPVLLVHGAADRETRPEHSERVYAALSGRRQLLRVPGATHEDALARAWSPVEAWIEAVSDVREERPCCSR